MKQFVSLEPLQWGKPVKSGIHGHQNSTGNLKAHIAALQAGETCIVGRLIWHWQIKLQIYKSAHGAKTMSSH